MRTIRMNLVEGLATLLAATAVLFFAGRAQAQQTWPEAQHRARSAPNPGADPDTPAFAWTSSRFALAGEVRTTWPQNGAARRLIGKDAPVGGGVSLRYDALQPTSKLVASVDLGWASTSTSNGSASGTESADLNTQLVSLGLSLRYHVFHWLAPYARVAGGIGWDKLIVSTSDGQFQDERSFGHGSVGGGIFLRSPAVIPRPSSTWLSFALMGSVEGSYYLASSSSFALQSSPVAGVKSPVPTPGVPIGEVGRNAPYLRIAVGIAF